ncbi:putative sphingolipid transporter spinster-like protein 2 [Cucumis melo var. makuwa]|uniref:Putative sphingolipid transporter spinster-like protein 2 n=1 Tax=Cucumis melo var. makuwa TaxID=1194695 RepID=A0A5D3E112_CUCMM|nr:putative sphingolipid transporter spinster-like protein 2 [Cucumis melo var. makuwa]
MAETDTAGPPTTDSTPSWFTPKRNDGFIVNYPERFQYQPSSKSWTAIKLLAVFCVINLLNYLDRGAIASNGVNGSQGSCTASGTCTSGTGIQGEFSLTNFEDGVLSSSFMVGLLVACPIFATLAERVNPFRLIGVGLSVWTFAVIGCAASFNFWSITICRMLVGVGEASFVSLAAPFIDDNAPAAQKTAWLGIFYMCIPSGYAVGYIFGGLVGGNYSWRIAFIGEAILMLPFAVLGFVIKPLQLKGFSSSGSYGKLRSVDLVASDVQETEASYGNGGAFSIAEDSSAKSSSSLATNARNQLSKFVKEIKELLVNKVYVINVLGYIAYTFVLGAYSYWGPKAGYSIYHMDNADLIFGGITVVSGVFGSLGGGYVLDFMSNTISNGFKLLSATTFIGAILCFSAFCFKNVYVYLALFAIGELFVFAIQGPVNYINLEAVKPSLRPLSMAMSTVAIHIFGDVPSSPLVGVLQLDFRL